MMPCRRITCLLFVFLLMSFGSAAEAQNSILVPLSPDSPNQEENENALSNWVKLQTDLYRIVLTFDEKAKLLERNLLRNEIAILNNEEIRFNAQAAQRQPNENGTYGGEMPINGSMLCSELNDALVRYIDKNTSALDETIQKLVLQSNAMSESDKSAFSQRLHLALSSVPNTRRAQEILFLCLYKYKNESGSPTQWSVEKTLRKWYAVQVPILDAWLGNVD